LITRSHVKEEDNLNFEGVPDSSRQDMIRLVIDGTLVVTHERILKEPLAAHML
jgi:hypothetical protein